MADNRLAGYRSVDDRIQAFWREMRESKTPARIASELIKQDDRSIAFRAEVWVHLEGQWVMLANGYAEDMRATAPKGKCMEVAETSAIGRALANAGYTKSEQRASKEEMESWYAAKDAEEREAGNITPMPTPEERSAAKVAPASGLEARRAQGRADEAKVNAMLAEAERDDPEMGKKVAAELDAERAKVGYATAKGTTRGATVEEAQAKQEQLAPEAKATVAAIVETEPDRLANFRPSFKTFIDRAFAAAAEGKPFDTIKAKFSEAKGKLTPEEVAEAAHQLGLIKRACEEHDKIAGDALAEFDELTDEEKKLMGVA